MSEDSKGTGGQEQDAPGSGVPAAGREPQDTGVSPTGGDAKTGLFTQEQLDRILEQRLARAERKLTDSFAAKETELLEELRQHREAEEKRKRAEMSELELAQSTADEATRRLAEMEQRAAQAELRAMRTHIIATEAAGMPEAWRSQVTGEDEAAIRESLAAVKAAWQEYKLELARGYLAAPPEQLAAEFGDDNAKALLAARQGKPVSLGTAGVTSPSAQQSPPEERDVNTGSLSSWMARVQRKKE